MPSSMPTENALDKAVNEFGIGTYDSDNGISSRGEDDEDLKSESSPNGDSLPGTHGTDPFGPDRLLSYPQTFSSDCRVNYDNLDTSYDNLKFDDFSSRISSALDALDNIHIAADNVYDHLVSLNLKQLQKTNKRDKSEDSRTFYKRLQEQAKQGPVFGNETLLVIKEYRVKIDKNTAKWLATQIENGLKPPTEDELSYVFDWIRDQKPDLIKFNFEKATEASDEWHESFVESDKSVSYKTNDVDYNFGDGYTMVLVPVDDLDAEGGLMQHCVGSYAEQVENGTDIYSLRDSDNKPHMTIELTDNEIEQVKGKKNSEPSKKYHPYIWEWATSKNVHKSIISYAPLESLEELSRDADDVVRRGVAENPNTPLEILARFSGDKNESVRARVAENPNTSPEILAKLSGDTDSYVRSYVAWNPNTPPEILAKLSGDTNVLVHAHVAQNPNTSPETLARLAEDEDGDVRWYVAENPNTPLEILTRLSGDKDEVVLRYVAQNPNTSPEILTKLSGDTNNLVRRGVAGNRSTSPETLARLAEDEDEVVRQSVAQNPNTSLEILTKLSGDTDERVRNEAKKRFESNTVTSSNHQIITQSELDKILRVADFSSRISSALEMLDNIHIAADNVYDHLVSLNLKQLQKTNKRDKSEDSRTFYKRLQEQSKQGPVFDSDTLQIIKEYRVKIDKNTAKWLATRIENDRPSSEGRTRSFKTDPPSNDELSYVFDWIRDQKPDLDKINFEEATEASDEWHERFKSSDQTGRYKTKNVDHDFGDGYTMVSVPIEDLDVEGNLMQHCVGSYKDQVKSGTEIYSLRGSNNKPHVTIELRSGKIQQVQGKQNVEPVSKYHPYIWDWAEKHNLHKSLEVICFAPPEALANLVDDEDPLVRQGLALNRNTPPEILARLFDDDDLYVRRGLAGNPDMLPEILVKLSADEDRGVLYLVGRNTNTPIKTLAKLADNDDSYVSSGVASNPNTPSEALSRLADHENGNVRHYVSVNPNTSLEVLVRLADDISEGVRWGVAGNPNTPPEVLVKLADDTSRSVRFYSAQNTNTPPEALAKLAKDVIWDIRMEAKERLRSNVITSSNHQITTQDGRIITAEEYVGELSDKLRESSGLLPGDQDVETTHRRPKTDNIDSVVPTVAETSLPDDHNNPSARSDYYDHMKIGYSGDEWADEDSGAWATEGEPGSGLPGVVKNEVTMDNFLNSLGNFWSGHETEDISGPNGFPSEDFSESANYDRSDNQDGGRIIVSTNHLAFSDRISSAFDALNNIHLANSIDYLVDLNLKQLQKTNKRDPNEDARAFYERLQEQAKSGPLFSAKTIQIIEEYKIKEKNTAKWLATKIESGLKPPYGSDLIGIFDWIRDQKPDLDKLDFEEAKESSDEWHEGFVESDKTGEYKTKNVDYDFGDGYTMVLVPVEDLDAEGDLMGHCVGSYEEQVESGTKIYSLRDPQNKPHVTIEFSGGKIQQVQGKENKVPVKKYHKYIWKWAEERNLHESYALFSFTPTDVLTRLSDSSDEELLIRIAENLNTSPEVLIKLSVNNYRVRYNVAHNPNTPPDILAKLASDSYIEVRQHVAYNPRTPPEFLSKLADDKDWAVRQSVALNPNTPPEILAKLSDDSDESVRGGVAINPNTPLEVLARLADDDGEWVRYGVAENPSAPPDILNKLSDDDDGDVRQSLAKNRNTPSEVLARLSGDDDKYVRRNVANNRNTPPEILVMLSGDKDAMVRKGVARNPNTPSGGLVVSTNHLAFSDRISSVISMLDNTHLAN